MMHTELYCDKLASLDPVTAIRAVHQSYLQLTATKDAALEESFDNVPAISACASVLAAAGHPGFTALRGTRYRGGSLLPSNEPRILKPVQTPFGILQVREIGELDCHGLFHKHDAGETLLATHPNGYSCHALLERMVKGDAGRVREQVDYILACGGTARHMDHILNSMQS